MPHKTIALRKMNTPVKVLFTGYLSTVALGYLFALIQILFTHGMADGKFGLSVDDVVYSYYGNRSGTTMETKLNGSMKANAPDEERFKIIQWVRDGADEYDYKDDGIETIVQNRCVMCHSGGSSLPNFNDFKAIKELSKQDEGATFSSLIRVSHIHLFGISFIFMFVGLIFSFSETSSTKYKSIAIATPYIFLVTDILSWWLTKLHPAFAWLVIIGGSGMAISFAFMWLVSILEMWLFDKAFVRHDGELHPRWSDYLADKWQEADKSKVVAVVVAAGIMLAIVGKVIWTHIMILIDKLRK